MPISLRVSVPAFRDRLRALAGRIEHANPHTKAQLRASTNTYREVLDRVPAAIYIAEPGANGRWYYVSPQIYSILGYTAAAWRRDPSLWSRRLHPDDREQVLRNEEQRAATERDPDSDASSAVEYRMVHRSGRVVWIRDDARLLPDADGRYRWHGVL